MIPQNKAMTIGAWIVTGLVSAMLIGPSGGSKLLRAQQAVLESGLKRVLGHAAVDAISRRMAGNNRFCHLPIDLRPAREDIRGFLFLILDELESFDRPLDHALHLVWRCLDLFVGRNEAVLRQLQIIARPGQDFVTFFCRNNIERRASDRRVDSPLIEGD